MITEHTQTVPIVEEKHYPYYQAVRKFGCSLCLFFEALSTTQGDGLPPHIKQMIAEDALLNGYFGDESAFQEKQSEYLMASLQTGCRRARRTEQMMQFTPAARKNPGSEGIILVTGIYKRGVPKPLIEISVSSYWGELRGFSMKELHGSRLFGQYQLGGGPGTKLLS